MAGLTLEASDFWLHVVALIQQIIWILGTLPPLSQVVQLKRTTTYEYLQFDAICVIHPNFWNWQDVYNWMSQNWYKSNRRNFWNRFSSHPLYDETRPALFSQEYLIYPFFSSWIFLLSPHYQTNWYRNWNTIQSTITFH